MKLIWAKLALQGPEWIDPTFSRSRIKRRGQREKVVISNRLPRFQIKPYSAIVGLVSE